MKKNRLCQFLIFFKNRAFLFAVIPFHLKFIHEIVYFVFLRSSWSTYLQVFLQVFCLIAITSWNTANFRDVILSCYGDPHCKTFDDSYFNFHGKCKYDYITTDCKSINGPLVILQPFEFLLSQISYERITVYTAGKNSQFNKSVGHVCFVMLGSNQLSFRLLMVCSGENKFFGLISRLDVLIKPALCAKLNAPDEFNVFSRVILSRCW